MKRMVPTAVEDANLRTARAGVFGWEALLVGAGLGGVVLSWAVAQHSLISGRWAITWLMVTWVPLWLAAAFAATRCTRRGWFVVLFALAVLARLAAASGTTPSISNDLYRYAWDAHVQLAGIDPYRYPPSARSLAHLRTQAFWPSAAGCRHIGLRPGCTVLNRPGVRTIYPPVAEAWFVAVHVVFAGMTGSRPWQLAAGLVDDLTILALAIGLRSRGKSPRSVGWYALCPLPVVELGGNGHVDGLALMLLVAALLALARGRRGLAGALVGGATMVKLYPALALATWWKQGRTRMVLAAVIVCAGSYLPHVLAVGWNVIGYLPGYVKEEHYSSGGRFLLLGMLGLPGKVTTALGVAVVLGTCAYIYRRGIEPAAALTAAMMALLLVTDPVQPWYAVTLAGVAVLAGAWWAAAVGLTAEVYYAAVVLNQHHQVAVGRLTYTFALLVVVLGYCWRVRAAGAQRPDAASVRGSGNPQLFAGDLAEK